MAENDLKVIQKAKELATHTLKVTSNANRYPKKYRFSLVDKMQNKSRDYDQRLILEACQCSNNDLANVLFASLVLDIGYDYISKRYWIPIARKDFQGYRRKAIYMYYDLLRLHRKADLIS